MADRRDFLRYAALSAVPLANGLGLAVANAVPARSPIRIVVVDGRHAASLAFGARLAATGAMLHTLNDGDVTDLWLDVLRPAWSQAPQPVAGLTRLPALFVLEQLAWSRGLRVVHHAEHMVPTGGGDAFPAASAERIAADAARAGNAGLRRPVPLATAAGLHPAVPPGRELLASFLLAPV
jgi:hypothetical protein